MHSVIDPDDATLKVDVAVIAHYTRLEQARQLLAGGRGIVNTA
jgi:hypothetical protein